MRNKKVISQLDSIDKFNTYSKFNFSYDKVFGSKTLKSFLKALAHPTFYQRRNFLDELSKKFPYQDNQFYRTQEIFSMTKSSNEEDKEYMKINTTNKNDDEKLKKNNYYSIKSSLAAQKILKLRKEWIPDFLLYNPKYKSIDKNIPSVIMSSHAYKNNSINKSTKLKKIKKNKNIEIEEITNNKNNKTERSPKILIKKDISNITNNDNNSKKKNKQKNKDNKNNIKLKKENKINHDGNNYDKKNNENKKSKNLLKILDKEKLTERTESNYSNILFTKTSTNITEKETKIKNFKKLFDMNMVQDREINFNNFLKTKNSKLSNNFLSEKNNHQTENELFDKRSQKHNGMDFKKMSNRKGDFIVNVNMLQNPDSLCYTPNYNFIKERMKDTFFGFPKKNINSTSHKKFLLKKLWCSNANFGQNYYLVDNDKLNTNTKFKAIN